MDEFEKELKMGFLQEAQQLLQDTEQCFLSLENNTEDTAILDKIFRLAHNIKGSSKAVGFDAMGAFTHHFESLLLKIKGGEVGKSIEMVNLLLRCNDHLRLYVEKLSLDLNTIVDSNELIEEIKHAQMGMLNQSSEGDSEKVETPRDLAGHENIKADESEESSNDFSDLTHQMAMETTQQIFNPTPKPLATSPAVSQSEDSIRVSLGRLEKLLNFVGEMVILQSVLREQSSALESHGIKKTVHQLGKVSKEVQDLSMSLRMLPIKNTFQKMQRIVRDTAQALHKNISFTFNGEETELDKTVIEHLGDPLVHIIRNAVDHGIESNEERKNSGKNEIGTINLSAYHQGGRLVIEVKDDGAGINTEILKKKAIEKGILRPDQKISEKDAVNLIFHAGFSTKSEVTEVSGRGVGMDVVRTNIEKLSGEIQIHTVLGQGTTFKIYLPLTLAIIDGMIIRSGEERFVIPLAQVHESLRPGKSDIQFNTNIGETLLLRGENLPLYRLSRLLGSKSTSKTNSNDGIAIVVRISEKPFSVFVDDIIGQTQIVIKQLGKELNHLKGFSGSAILGDGRPALILELPELSKKNIPIQPPLSKESAA